MIMGGGSNSGENKEGDQCDPEHVMSLLKPILLTKLLTHSFMHTKFGGHDKQHTLNLQLEYMYSTRLLSMSFFVGGGGIFACRY